MSMLPSLVALKELFGSRVSLVALKELFDSPVSLVLLIELFDCTVSWSNPGWLSAVTLIISIVEDAMPHSGASVSALLMFLLTDMLTIVLM